MKIIGEETMASHEMMEARQEVDKPASVDTTPEVAHEQEVPLEDAVVMPVGEPRKRRRDRRNLAAQRRQKKEERNLDAKRHGKQQNTVAARRGTTRHAKVARRKENLIRKNRTRDNMVRRTSKRRTFGKKRQPTQKDKNGLRNRRLTHRLRN
jgi:hypothetical protein